MLMKIWVPLLYGISVLNTSWASNMVLNRNGYEGVLVAIHPDVPENTDILTQIKSLFTNASEYLHRATRQRAYFKHVTILIPNTWTERREYDNVTNERFQESDFRIQESNPSYAHNPYTKQPRGCGEAGDYVHMTPEYVLDSGIERVLNWGDPGRVLVHEFAHLRYGVFDEYGFDDSDEFPLFYVNDRRRTKVTGCTDEVKGVSRHGVTQARCRVDRTTRLPEKGCRFYAHISTNQAKGSVMFFQFVHSVDSFCEVGANDTSLAHNRDAPNLHNKMCNGSGSWDVISKHKDFQNGNNPPTPYPGGAALKIKLVYQRSKAIASGNNKIVLVMDVSGSMRYKNRIFKLGQTASKFIYDVMRDQDELGMVTFSTRGHEWRPVISMSNQSVRADEANALPQLHDLSGSTSIGGGISIAMEMLQAGDNVLKGSVLILITDGEENEYPYIADVIDNVTSSGIIVHSIAYSRQASVNLVRLATETGGIFQYYSESSTSTALDGFLDNVQTALAPVGHVLPSVLQRRLVVLNVTSSQIRGTVLIDSSLGYQTEFFFTCSQRSTIEVNVVGPSSLYTPSSPEYDEDDLFKVIRVKPASTEPGLWSYYLVRKTSGSADDVVSVFIRSRPHPTHSPVSVKAYMSQVQVTYPSKTAIYAEITRGYSSVLGAEATAVIERPTGDPVTISLRDNGQGVDTLRGDGIYSAYFTQFSGNGKYSVDVLVKNPGSAAIVEHNIGQGGAYSIHKPNLTPTLTRLDPFTRVGSAGGFNVSAYVPGDSFPPSRITDLLISAVDFDARQVTLQWTAPGDDYDTGRAELFELRYGRSYENVRARFETMTLIDDTFLLSGNLTPQASGNKMTVTVRTPVFGSGDILVFGVRAIDDAANSGDLSNLVAIGRQPDGELDEDGFLSLGYGDPPQPRDNTNQQPISLPDALGSADIGLIIGCTLAGLVVLCGVFVVIVRLAVLKPRTTVKPFHVKPSPFNTASDWE